MRELLAREVHHNTIESWLISLAIVLGFWLIARLGYALGDRLLRGLTARTATRIDDILIGQMRGPVVFVVALIGTRVGLERLTLPETTLLVIEDGYQILVALTVAWTIARLYDGVNEEYLLPAARRPETRLDVTLLHSLRGIVQVLILGCGLLVGVSNAGFDVGALLAGVGIGGLAFALAAQDTVANLFGGVMLITQRPFQLGDRIRVHDVEGIVRSIGLRGTLVTDVATEHTVLIPNRFFIDAAIHNLDGCAQYVDVVNVTLHRDTAPAAVEALCAAISAAKIEDAAFVVATTKDLRDGGIVLDLVLGTERFVPGGAFVNHLHKRGVVRHRLLLRVMALLGEQGVRLAMPLQVRVGADGSASEGSLFSA